MNLLQKNPRDSKHREFHDGEYEYWPVKSPTSGKSASFPSALLNGLEVVAAALAAALLAAALSVLYTQTAPRYITENYAVVNVNIYNNVQDVDVRYTLFRMQKPDIPLQEGILEENEHTLEFQNLTPGTHYLLVYESPEETGWAKIGDFDFITPGTPLQPSGPAEDPLIPATEPESTQPAQTETVPPEETTEASVPEETTGPTTPPGIWYPPAPTPVPPEAPTEKPEEAPTEPPADEPTEAPTEPPADEPTEPPTEPSAPVAVEPEIDLVEYHVPEISGDENDCYYSFRQKHTFQNIPDGTYALTVTHNGNPITDYAVSVDPDTHVMTVEFTGVKVPNGQASDTSVTVCWDDSTEATSTHSLVTPSMEDVSLDVTKNEDGSHTFTVTVTAVADSTYSLAFETMLTAYGTHPGVSVDLTETSPGCYTGSYTTTVVSDQEIEEAYIYVIAVWDMAGSPSDVESPQSLSNFYSYEI